MDDYNGGAAFRKFLSLEKANRGSDRCGKARLVYGGTVVYHGAFGWVLARRQFPWNVTLAQGDVYGSS